LQPHFVRGNEAELLVKSAALIRRVQDNAFDALLAAPRDDCRRQQTANSAASPFWFRENIHY
jgi:hypothetical protein